ncbi:MAG: ATP-binding protein, partial [Fulvivirga sp.]|nr:ATP-binding protein [Fulvivirga sp.]
MSWEQAKKQKEATLNCYWFDSKPFIYHNTENELTGLEYDLINEFAKFVNDTYNVNLKTNWIEVPTFRGIYDTIKSTTRPNTLAIASFSITDARREDFQFSPPHLPNISVIVSSLNLPVTYSESALDSIINKLTAVTVPGTTLEDQLQDLKEAKDLDYNFKYVATVENILNTIDQNDNYFGYIELYTYLSALDNHKKIQRQHPYSLIKEGIGFALPKDSDWIEPLKSFINQPEFTTIRNKAIARHFGPEIPYFINSLTSDAVISSKDEVLILTKEKEAQTRELINSALSIQRKNLFNIATVIGIIVLLIIVSLIYWQYKSKLKAGKILSGQKLEIERQNRQLLELDRQKNNLIHILAHDLRAPINNISGLVELLKMNNTDDSEEVIDKILHTTERLKAMIKKILDVESLESQSINISKETVDLKEVMDEVLDEFRNSAENKKIELVTAFQNTSYPIKGDKIYLLQVFENLISNALKFSEKNTKITISLKKSHGKIIGTVSDQGPGISQEDQQKLFGKFQRLSAKPTQGESSTGLGLSIAKKYVEMMAGKIRCE